MPRFALLAAGLLQLSPLDVRAAPLPDGPLILGYQNWAACDLNQTVAACAGGVNVVLWFATNLERNATTGAPTVTSGPDYDCVATVAAALDAARLPTTHLISIGGWDAPHPDPAFSGDEARSRAAAAAVAARPSPPRARRLRWWRPARASPSRNGTRPCDRARAPSLLTRRC